MLAVELTQMADVKPDATQIDMLVTYVDRLYPQDIRINDTGLVEFDSACLL
jgi:hypothetical protein